MSISREFVLAGDATFTIECPGGPKPHYTFNVSKVEANDRWPAAWFVKILSGPDNEGDYLYIGKLDDFTGQCKHTAKSGVPADAYPFRLLNRILARIWSDDHAAYEQHGFKVHHEGRCGRCGRKLTTPQSVENGIGPECIKILQGA